MKTYKILFFAFISFLLIGVITSTSCKKPQPPKAIITVYDTADYKVEGAMVVIYVDKNGAMIDPNNEVEADTQYTNSSGTVEFENEFEAIFDVYAEKETDSLVVVGNDTIKLKMTGEGVIILKNDELDEEPVYLKL